MTTLRSMFAAAAASGLTFTVGADGDVDYSGASPSKAMEALDACDELDVVFYGERAGKRFRTGAILFVRNESDVNDIDNICDAGGWANDWMDENCD